jgi:hypothetical protein
MAPVTLNNVWMSAQRLPISERKILPKMLADLDSETEEERKARVASSIDQFFGGWSEDPRSVDEIKADIRNSRTENTSHFI